MEMWKNIEVLGNNYSASNMGNLKNNKTGRILKTFNYRGYKKRHLIIMAKHMPFLCID